jgi:5-methyltetrahydrofolate--homocysteine methyltransferase
MASIRLSGFAGPALDGPTLLDGAMATSLLARGLPEGTPPEEWVFSRPEEIEAIHAAHAEAGARVLLTCTFSCAAPRFAGRIEPARLAALCDRAVRLARKESGPLVAGALGPTGLSPPLGAGADASKLARHYAPPFEALAEAGADLLWLETQHDLGEALAALGAARATGLGTVVTFTFVERDGAFRTPGGGDPLSWLTAAEAAGASAVGVNCVFPGRALCALARVAVPRLGVPFVAKPSPGLPGAVLSAEAFAQALLPALEAGVRVAGGCCGAGPEHLRALGAALAQASSARG